jgi:ComEC/Rec2-related protein
VAGFAYFCGIAAASLISGTAGVIPFAPFVLGIALIGVALLAGLSRKRQLIAMLCLFAGAGALMFTLHDITARQPVLNTAGQSVTLTGTVTEITELGFYTSIYTVRTHVNETTTRIQVTAPESRHIRTGDIVQAQVTLSHFRNSGLFPEQTYNHSRGILLKGTADEMILVNQGSRTPLDLIREYNETVRAQIAAAFPGDTGGLLRAVALGDSSALSPELRQNVRTAGAAHYTAVSGLHMTLVTHMIVLLFGLFKFMNNRRVKFAVTATVIVILAVFFNMTASVIRAAVMLIICYGGELFMRKGTTLNSLGFALFIILLFQPHAVFDAGLIMSFSGTFGVGVVAPALMRKRRFGRVAEAFIVSVCASLCVLPASAIFFGGFSILSPLTSVVILPFFTVAVAAVMLFAVFAPIFAPIAQACLLIAGIMSRIMGELTAFLGRISFAWFALDYRFVPLWTAFAVAAIAVIHLVHKRPQTSTKAACIAVAALVLMVNVYNFAAVRGFNAERTYITIYSDSVAAWVRVRQSDTEVLIITADTPRAYMAVRESANNPAAVVLLSTARNNEQAFSQLAENMNAVYLPPDTTDSRYDINGRFTLDIRYTRDNEVVLDINDYTILFTRASNDNATPANVVVATGVVRNKRDFNADYVVYVSRAVPVDRDYEHNAYFEPLYLILEMTQ